MLSNIIIIIISMINLATLHLQYILFTDMKIRRWWVIYLTGAVSAIMLTFIPSDLHTSDIISFSNLAPVILILIFSEGTFAARILNWIIVDIFAVCIRVLVNLITLLPGLRQSLYHSDTFNYSILAELFFSVAVLGILLIMYFVKRRLTSVKGEEAFFSRSKIVIYILIFGLLATVILIGTYCSTEYEKKGEASLLLITTGIIASACIEGIILLVFYLRHIYKRQRMYNAQIKKTAETEQRYLKDLLKRESDTRRFRHDLKNHLLVIKDLAIKSKTQELSAYIDKINDISLLNNKRYYTGNIKLDALTNYYVNSLDNNIKVNVTGTIREGLVPDEMRLAAAYGNLLQNAVEALELQEYGDKFLNIEFTEGSAHIRIQITNSLMPGQATDLKTTKADKRNHGLGLENIYEYVEHLGGEFVIDAGEKVFVATVTLPIRKEEVTDVEPGYKM